MSNVLMKLLVLSSTRSYVNEDRLLVWELEIANIVIKRELGMGFINIKARSIPHSRFFIFLLVPHSSFSSPQTSDYA